MKYKSITLFLTIKKL